MPIKLARIHDEFEDRIDELSVWEAHIDVMVDAAASVGTPAPASAAPKEWLQRRLSESVLVLAISHWERFVEQLFASYLASDVAALGKSYGLPKLDGATTVPMAQALISGDRYFDVRNFEELSKKARRLLVNNPFNKATPTQRKQIDEMLAMRNHILHKSRHSKKTLGKHIQRRHDVGVHLVSKSKGVRRLKNYLQTLKHVSAGIRP